MYFKCNKMFKTNIFWEVLYAIIFFLVADDFVCTLVRDANLKGAVDILKTTGIFDSLTQVIPTYWL